MRILTYNIRGGLGMDGQRSTARIAEVIAAASAEIVCLQEVHQRLPWSGWINQPGQLARVLGMRFVFQKSFGWPWGGYGLGVMTRLPITGVVRHRLHSRGEPRGALEVTLRTSQGLLAVWCTHLGLNRDERKVQLGQLGEWIGATTSPVILCGDFNDLPSTDEIQALLTRTGLHDVGQASNLPTYPSDAPRARIDVILQAPQINAYQISTVPSLASDHVPLGVDWEWTADAS